MRGRPILRPGTLALVLRTIAVNKKRCIFAVLGIVFGITTVTTMASLGHSAQQALAHELERLGTNMVIIEAGRSLHGRGGQGPIVRTLTERDIAVLEDELGGIAAAAPVFLLPGELGSNGIAVRTDIVATQATYMQISGTDVSHGRPFSQEDETAAGTVMLLGQTLAGLLFPGSDPIGETVKVNSVPFEVIGVLAEKGMDASGEDHDDVAIIPLTAARERLGAGEHLTHIYLEAEEADMIPSLKEDIVPVLRAAHQLGTDDADDFTVLDQTQLLAVRSDVLGSVRDLVNVLAIVTLLAGGLGITAVQLISVRERTSEIGLQRAIGASKKDVMVQFLLESAILGVIGGLVGVSLGVIVPLALALALSLTPAVAWPVLLISLIVSVVIGLVAGIYPALFASRLDPVVALRSA